MLVHVWLVAASALPVSTAAAVNRLFPPPEHWTIWAGWGALISLVVFLAPTFKFFGDPGYARWKRLHLLSAAALLLALAHALPLTGAHWPWWLLGALALGAYVWRKGLSRHFARLPYRVTAVDTLGPDMVELRLRPEQRGLQHAPAQFVYLAPEDPNLPDGRGEEHPFTLASAAGADELRIGIKALGDATRALQTITPDSRVRIEGPYGTFLQAGGHRRPALWIGAGIGITPFVSAARSLAASGRAAEVPVRLFYLVNNADKAHYAAELETLAAGIPGLELILHRRDHDGLLGRDFLARHCPDFPEREVWICGPPPLDRHLRRILKAHGVPPAQDPLRGLQPAVKRPP